MEENCLKVEAILSAGNSQPVWEGVKSKRGLQRSKHTLSLIGRAVADHCNVLNVLCNGFNKYGFREELAGSRM